MKAETYLRARNTMMARAKEINRASNYSDPHSYCERAERMHYHYVAKRNVPDATPLLLISLANA